VAKPDEDQPSPYEPPAPPPEPPPSPPSRIPALGVGVVFGPGAGHFLVGLPRRGVVFALSSMAMVVLSAVAVARAPSTATVALFAAPVLIHIGSLIDLAIVPKERLSRVRLAAIGQILALLVAGVFLRNGVRNHAVEMFQLPSGSMLPTLAVGDHFFVSKLAPAPVRGDVVTFPNPENEGQSFVKRVIGVAGDKISQQAGVLSVNGEPVRRCAIGKLPDGGMLVLERLGDHTYLVRDDQSMPQEERSWTVAQSEVFVIGDNRANSHDSRTWFAGEGGGVKLDKVIGRATFRVFRAGGLSFGHVDDLALPQGAEGLGQALAKCRAELGG
jgi:signal peptidase I